MTQAELNQLKANVEGKKKEPVKQTQRQEPQPDPEEALIELGKTTNPYYQSPEERILGSCIVKGVDGQYVEYDKGRVIVREKGHTYHITIKQVK